MNSRAGIGGRPPVREIEDALARVGVGATLVLVEPEQIGAELRILVDARAPVVAVAGGDGTLLTAAAVLAGTRTALAVIPTGTLNHFARRVGIGGIGAAAVAIAGGHVERVPVGIVDDRMFLNTATFGLYADVVRLRERLRRWLGKWPAATVAFMGRIAPLRRLDLTFVVDGEVLQRQTPLLWMGIGRGSFPLVHEAEERRRSPDLEVVVIRSGGTAGALRLLWRISLAIRGSTRPVADPGLEVSLARAILIRAGHHGVGVTLDGEVTRLHPPIFIGVVDDALSVVVPEPPRAMPRRSKGSNSKEMS